MWIIFKTNFLGLCLLYLLAQRKLVEISTSSSKDTKSERRGRVMWDPAAWIDSLFIIWEPCSSMAVLCAVLSHIRYEGWSACVCAPVLLLSDFLIFHRRIAFPTWNRSMLVKADFSVPNSSSLTTGPVGVFQHWGEDLWWGRHLMLQGLLSILGEAGSADWVSHVGQNVAFQYLLAIRAR